MALRPKPKKIEKTRICRTSLPAMAETMLVGKTWVRKSRRLSEAAFSPVCAPASGSGRASPAPGWKRLAAISPRESETTEAVRNQPMDRAATRPTERVSPKLAMPETMVAKTSGAMIILIKRRKMSVASVKWAASALASSGEPACPCSTAPTAMPRTSPMPV